MEAPLIVLVSLMTLWGLTHATCPENCLLDNLVAMSKCSWNNIKELESDGEVCKGCYKCSTNLLSAKSEGINILPFLLSKSFDPVGKKLIPNTLADIQDGAQDGGKSKLKHVVYKREKRAIRDPGAENQMMGNRPNSACRRLMLNINNNDAETLNDVMMNCPTLDCVGTFHHDTCDLDSEVCIWTNGRLCPDCPKCREEPSKSRDKKSVKSKLSPNDLNSSIKQPIITVSEG